MTPLWLVLTVSGYIQGTWGPLPYDIKECRSRAVAFIQEIQEKADQGRRGNWKGEVRASCYFHIERPRIGDFFLYERSDPIYKP